MNLSEARELAQKLMSHWKCDGWRFQWSQGKTRLGHVNYHKKVLYLSQYFVALNSENEVKETILHEIAHIKAGTQNGHNHVWKEWCQQVGAKPQRCADKSVNLVKAKYVIFCPLCERVLQKRYRRINTERLERILCRQCGKPSYGKLQLRWNK